MFNITVQHKKQTHYWHYRIVLVRIRRQTSKYLKTPPKNCEKTLENRHERFLMNNIKNIIRNILSLISIKMQFCS